MFKWDIDINAVMMERGISITAARALFEVNRLVKAAAAEGQRDSSGIAYCDVGWNVLGQRIGKSRRTIDRAIAELKAAGLVKVERTRDNARIYILEGMEG